MRKFYLSASHGNISVNSSFVTTEFSGDDFDDDEMSNISNDTVVNEENNKDRNLSSSSSGMVAAYFTPKTSDTSNIIVHSIPVQFNSPINSFHSTDIKPEPIVRTSTVKVEKASDYLMPAEFYENPSSRNNSKSTNIQRRKPKPKWTSPVETHTPPVCLPKESLHQNKPSEPLQSVPIERQIKAKKHSSKKKSNSSKKQQKPPPPPLPKNPPSVRKQTRRSKPQTSREKELLKQLMCYQAKIPREYRLEPTADPAFFRGEQYIPQYYHDQLWNEPGKLKDLKLQEERISTKEKPKEMVSVEVEVKIGEETLKEHQRQNKKEIM
jgi:hypothetical protein